MVDTYVDCKHERQQVTYPHPDLEPILKPTYGVILYQEQVMQIAQVLAGYTLGGADILRRIMGKKKPEEMAKQRQIFVDGSVQRGIKAQLAESIFDLMEKFAGYGFNKSHSAAYAVLSYHTAWLKTHYPAEFMAAVLSSDMDSTDKVVNFIDDARSQELTIESPNVNASDFHFLAKDATTVVYGLGAIKGVGRSAIEAIVEERVTNGPYDDLLDFCRRVDLQRANRRVLEALIYSGAMDDLGENRATLMHALPELIRAADQESRDRDAGQVDLFGAPTPTPMDGQPERLPEWPEEQRLMGERDTLGLYLTGHPINPWIPDFSQFISSRLGGLAEIYRPPPNAGDGSNRRQPGQPCLLAGLVLNVRRRGSNMAFVSLDDQTGRVEVALYRDAFSRYQDMLQKDQILVVDGLLSLDRFSGGFQLKAQHIMTPDEALAEYARALQLTLGSNPDIDPVKRILDAHRPGTSDVLISWVNGEAEANLRLGSEWRVRITRGLLDELDACDQVTSARAIFPA
jgi:DNA polymerase-3 subunit alpha